jgi:hypothetical protein
MAFLGCNLAGALGWFHQNFDIPEHIRPLQRHAPNLDEWKHVTLHSLIHCGIWAKLTHSQRAILAPMWESRDPSTGLIRLSYGAILDLSGLGSRKTVTAAIGKFEEMRLLEVQRTYRCTSVYRFIEDEKFLKHQRESLESNSADKLVPAEGTTFPCKSEPDDKNLVPSEGTRLEEVQLVPSEGTGSFPPSHTGLSSARGNQLEKSSDNQKQVLRIAERRLLVFPCRPGQKIPAIANWQKLATADQTRILQWFQKFLECNWAIRTGPASGIFVLDVDGDDGFEILQRLIRDHSNEPLPDTLGVKTVRGQHYYFRFPPDVHIPNSVRRIGFGLDIRGEGGYVLCPPSVHPDGSSYEWLDGRDDKPIASAPKWLLRAIEQASLADSREAILPRCPECKSYALYRKNNIGAFQCETCGLKNITK